MERWNKIQRWTWDLGATADAVQGGFMVILEVAVLWVGVYYWRIGKFTVGDLALLQGYMFQIFDNLYNVGRNIRNLYEAVADANEMTEILVHKHELTDAPGATKLSGVRGDIEFNNVTFRYKNNSNIFTGFNLKIPAGQKVALVGTSGGGKSTVVKLLLRFYDLQSGKVLIDGQDISQVTQDSLRDQIALVPQEPILFHRPIMENIRYARPSATDEEVVQALTDIRAANVDVVTFGQYMRPTKNHLPVQRYVHPDEFTALRDAGLALGFMEVVAGPLVRSSYRAERALDRNNVGL
jgi:ATP-binding cassette subfamily B protein